jgi:hypothetical protein
MVWTMFNKGDGWVWPCRVEEIWGLGDLVEQTVSVAVTQEIALDLGFVPVKGIFNALPGCRQPRRGVRFTARQSFACAGLSLSGCLDLWEALKRLEEVMCSRVYQGNVGLFVTSRRPSRYLSVLD